MLAAWLCANAVVLVWLRKHIPVWQCLCFLGCCKASMPARLWACMPFYLSVNARVTLCLNYSSSRVFGPVLRFSNRICVLVRLFSHTGVLMCVCVCVCVCVRVDTHVDAVCLHACNRLHVFLRFCSYALACLYVWTSDDYVCLLEWFCTLLCAWVDTWLYVWMSLCLWFYVLFCIVENLCVCSFCPFCLRTCAFVSLRACSPIRQHLLSVICVACSLQDWITMLIIIAAKKLKVVFIVVYGRFESDK